MTKKPDKTLNEKADTTNDQVASDDAVSRTEHSVGSRQPDDGTYDELRQQPPLQARDIPQKIVTAENDTPTPGEK
jgi:hypothetical protein